METFTNLLTLLFILVVSHGTGLFSALVYFCIGSRTVDPNEILDDSQVVLDTTPGRPRRIYVGEGSKKVSQLEPFIAGARDNVIVALAGLDGDGTADPRFLNVYLETR